MIRLTNSYDYFPKDCSIKDYVLSRINIINEIQPYTKLEKSSGNYFIGICPFFYCKKPYFKVNHKSRIFKCLSCNTSGNIFSFFIKMKLVTYVESYDSLVEKYKNSFNSKYLLDIKRYIKEFKFNYALLSTPITSSILPLSTKPIRNNGTILKMRRYGK